MARKRRPDSPREEFINAIARYPLPQHQDRSRESTVKIVEAAEHVLVEQGIDGFSMAAVAAQAGLSVGGLYRRFASKEDLLYVVQDLALKHSRERYEAALTQRVFPSAIAAATAIVEGLCSAIGGDAETLHRALMGAGREAPSLIRRGLESRERSFQSFRLIILPHLKHLSSETTEHLVVIVWEILMGGVMNKITTQSQALREMSWPTFQAELTTAVTAYLNAHLNPPSD